VKNGIVKNVKEKKRIEEIMHRKKKKITYRKRKITHRKKA